MAVHQVADREYLGQDEGDRHSGEELQQGTLVPEEVGQAIIGPQLPGHDEENHDDQRGEDRMARQPSHDRLDQEGRRTEIFIKINRPHLFHLEISTINRITNGATVSGADEFCR